MELDSEEYYNLNRSLRSQVNHLLKAYSKLKSVIKSSEATSKRLSSNLGPLQSKLSGLNSLANTMLKSGSKNIGQAIMGGASGQNLDISSIGANIMRSIMGGARATGGNVSQGVPYVVGERGAEIFTPSSSGNIAPSNAFGTKRSVNVVMNINTPDLGSFQKSESQIVSQIARAMSKSKF
ncbi:MAG: hypothetical protein K0T99_01355 [Alphaproteobacteria bacterium]|nr:hypothetical protein [Alphaproteobacteria bacterium]